MKTRALVLLSLSLALASAATAAPNRQSPEWLRGPVHSGWHEGLKASRLDLSQPVVLTPLAYRDGVALYRVRGTVDGVTDRIVVRVPVDPTHEFPAPRDRKVPAYAKTCASDSPRCDIPGPGSWSSDDTGRCLVRVYSNANYNDLFFGPPIDINTLDFSIGTNLNDKISSLQTTCAPAYFFEHKNWGGSSLYVPANTSLPNLSTQGFNDKITSFYHVLP